jgi:riboflavin kinase/FMN adenylyltransferase
MALGNFDGLHLGHHAVLQEMLRAAKDRAVPAAVMTFEPHPRRLFRPELPPLRILPLAEKLRRLEAMGVDFVIMQRFNHAFSRMTASNFIADLLVKKLAVSGIVTGENFFFGHKRGGDKHYLAEQAAHFGFDYTALKSCEILGDRCSSTRLRGALAGGDMLTAQALLGRPYALNGVIQKGDQRGRELGFPTANLHPAPGLFHPAYGVYAVCLKAEGQAEDYPSVANFGIRPMYRLQRPILETHCIGASPDLYGRKVTVSFHHYLRGEKKFDSVEALIAQMHRDREAALEKLGG